MEASVLSLSGRALYGRMVGSAPPRTSIRDWILASLGVTDGRLLELSLFGRGIFCAHLSDELCTLSLLARSPILSGSRIIFLYPWYPGFSAEDFERRHDTPRFPVTLSFPGMPPEFRELIPGIAAHWGIVLPGSLSAKSGTPRIQVLAPGSTTFPDIIEIGFQGSSYLQRFLVTGRPGQCLRCHEFGHLVGSCPRRPPRQQPRQPTAPPTHPPSTHPSHPSTTQPAAGGWQPVDRRHSFRGGQLRPPQAPVSSPVAPVIIPVAPAIVPLSPPVVPGAAIALSGTLCVTPSGVGTSASPQRQISQRPPPTARRVLPSFPKPGLEISAMDTDFPLLALTSPPPPSGRKGKAKISASPDLTIPRAFLGASPPSWRFDVAEASADSLGPLEFRVYMIRRGQRALFGSRQHAMLSFLAPFSGETSWSEESVLAFSFQQIHHHLSGWLGGISTDFITPQLPHCIGAARWLDGLQRFCIPVILQFDASWEPPLIVHEWQLIQAAKSLSCSLDYLSAWFSSVQDFLSTGYIPCLPADGSLDGTISSVSSPRKENKRQRK